jgi:hypothetical protein
MNLALALIGQGAASQAPRFHDDRCDACEHDSVSHHAGMGKCYKCPAPRRCMHFIVRPESPK